MNSLKLSMLAAVIACASGCSSLPKSMEVSDSGVQKITWTKGSEATAFRDQNGVCHTYSIDVKATLEKLGEQVKACFNGSLPMKPAAITGVSSVNVAWNKVPRARIAGVYAEATGQGTIKGKGGGWGSAHKLFYVRGFFQYHGNTCHVVVPDGDDYVETLGHEFKHCIDGYFHDNGGEWHDESNRRM